MCRSMVDIQSVAAEIRRGKKQKKKKKKIERNYRAKNIMAPLLHRATITTVLRPFVWDYPGEPVPEETFTHPPSWSSSNLYQLLPSTAIHSILSVQITCLAIFLHNLSPCPIWSTLGLEPATSYSIHFFTQSVSSFHNTCPYHLFLVFLSTPYLELYLLDFYLNITHPSDHSHLSAR